MRERPLVLISDDDASLLGALELTLKRTFEVHSASSVIQAKALSSRFEYDAAIIDLNYEGQEYDGIHLLDHLNRKSPGTFLIVLSGDTNVRRAVEATRRKLFSFIHKDETFVEQLNESLHRAIQVKRANHSLATKAFLSESVRVKEIITLVERIVRSGKDASILLNGPSGSGKEFLAQHIGHLMNLRVVAANMAGIPKETAESVLFGHERGAFTGALSNKIGLIENANGGIFFLDEIGECSPEVQAKLLRVIQEKEVQPLGSTRSRKVNVRFIAATHRNLEKMVTEGTFRLDLLQRLNTFVLSMPPLQDRPEDIRLYANLFLEQNSDDGTRFDLASDGLEELLNYSWPGNVRELHHVIQRIVILSSKTHVDREAVRQAIQMGKDVSEKGLVAKSEDNSRRDLILRSLTQNNGNKRQTAKNLGVSEATLYRWIQECGLSCAQKRGQTLLESEKNGVA